MNIPRKTQIIIIVVFIILATIITALVQHRYEIFTCGKDSMKIYEEYGTISKNNNFKYINITDAIKFLKEGTGIVYFGFPECPWCKAYLPILEKKSKENHVDKIYYCNIKEDREKGTKEYNELVTLLNNYLYDDDNGNKRVYVPDIYVVLDGKILGHNNDTSTISGGETEKYYTKEAKEKLEKKLNELIQKVYTHSDKCKDDGKGC